MCKFLFSGVSVCMLPHAFSRLLAYTPQPRPMLRAARRLPLSALALTASLVVAAMSTGRAAVPATGQITGTVTAEGTGTGIPGVRISVYNASGQFVTDTFSSGPSAPFTVTGLPTGSY